MLNKKFENNLIDMIENSTSSYKTVEYIKNILTKNGFTELKEEEKWVIKSKKHFVIRNDASIVAFEISRNENDAFSIVTTHCDTPSLLLKPMGNYTKDGYLKYNVMPYGGLLNYGWFDHPLSISGRIVYKENGEIKRKIIDAKETAFVIPSVAIHQNDNANSNLDLNMQIDLQPITGITNNKNDWISYLKKITNVNDIIDYDLHLYNNSHPQIFGLNKDLLFSPRIDNITSVYSALESFLNSKSNNIKVFCSFNNEEVGSLTEEGADSNFLIDILKRISAALDFEIAVALSKSLVISSDNTHAIHPNHSEHSDVTGALHLGDGVAIIKEVTSTTNAISSSIIKTLCDNKKIKYQYSTTKNDLSSGSTLSGISLRHLSVLSIDVGVSQLAMHSSCEICSLKDVYELYKLMKSFYEADIRINSERIVFKKKRASKKR